MTRGRKKGTSNFTWTQAQTERQLFIVYSGCIQGATPNGIKRSLQAEFPRVKQHRYDDLKARVQAQLQQEEKEAGVTRRAETIRRIQARIQALDSRAREYERPTDPPRKPTDEDMRMARMLYAEARQQESLLADITGVKAPIKVEVETKVHETVVTLMATMSPEQITIFMQRYKETERLADIGRQRLLPEKVNGVHAHGITKKPGGK